MKQSKEEKLVERLKVQLDTLVESNKIKSYSHSFEMMGEYITLTFPSGQVLTILNTGYEYNSPLIIEVQNEGP
jgi:hypothetical protein